MNCRAGARHSQGFGVPDFSFETASLHASSVGKSNGGQECPPSVGWR